MFIVAIKNTVIKKNCYGDPLLSIFLLLYCFLFFVGVIFKRGSSGIGKTDPSSHIRSIGSSERSFFPVSRFDHSFVHKL